MKNSSHQKERRDHPRIMISLPANFDITGGGAYPSLTIDASRSGLLIQTLKEMPVGTKLNIEVLLPKKLKLSKLGQKLRYLERHQLLGSVSIWPKVYSISNEDYLELSHTLSNPSCLKEVYFAEESGHDQTLIVQTK